MSLLGIDVGISGCKAVAFDLEGHALGQAYREYHLYQPQPGWMELDPAEVWAAVSAVVREAAAAAGDPVTALAIATHGESVVPVDATGAPIYRFITAIDTRAVKQMQWWEEKVGAKRLFDITGMPPHPMYTANKLMWLRAYDPAVFNAATRFLCMADFLFTRMGLPPTMDHSLASRTMLQDIRTRTWDAELLALAGLEAERLSATVPSGTLLGEIAPDVAANLGLAAGAVAVTGGHDHCCGSLGVGATRAGMMMDSTGTVECVTAVMETLVLDDNLLRSNLPVEPHTVAGMYVVLGWSSVGGALLKWYRDTFARAEIAEAERLGRSAYDVILAEAIKGPSPVLILPHFVGSGTPELDPLSKGAILGPTLSTTRRPDRQSDHRQRDVRDQAEHRRDGGRRPGDQRATGHGRRHQVDAVAANQSRHPGPAGQSDGRLSRRRAWAARCWPASPPASTPPPPRPSPAPCASTARTSRIRSCKPSTRRRRRCTPRCIRR